MDAHDKVFHAVLKGGGPRSFPYLGAIAYLEEQGYKIGEIRGTSAGAIIGGLLAAGLSANEIIKSVYDTDFDTFRRGRLTEKIPIFQTALGGVFSLPFDLLNLALYGGFYSRRALEAWMRDRFRQKNVDPEITLEHVPRFRAYAMDITDKRTQRIVEFSSETTPHVSVIKAVSMSSSVPGIFEPEHYEGSLLVDAAWANNIPIQSFVIAKRKGQLDAPVLVMTNQLERPLDTSASPLFYKLLYFLISAVKKFPLTNAVAGPAEALLDAQGEVARQLFGDWAYFVELNSDVGVLHFGFQREKKKAIVLRGRNDMQRYFGTAEGWRFRMEVLISQIQRVLRNMSARAKYRYEIGFQIKSTQDVDEELRDRPRETASDAKRLYHHLGFLVRSTHLENGVVRLIIWMNPGHQNWNYASLLAEIERQVCAFEETSSPRVGEHATAPSQLGNNDVPQFHPVTLDQLTSWQSLTRQYAAASQYARFDLQHPEKVPAAIDKAT